MSASQSLTSWVQLTSCPTNTIDIPIGIDRNNYIVIDRNVESNKINCIYKYNIENDKWIKMDSFSSENVSHFSTATLDAKKQILFLVGHNTMTQMRFNTNQISNDNHNAEITHHYNLNSIMVNDSLFVFCGGNGNSILKWNSENKTLTTFTDMYNKMEFGAFALIYNHKNNCLLFFGGIDFRTFKSVDYIWNLI
eukprot:531102_1